MYKRQCLSLKKLEFPEQITSIGNKAFYNCSLEEVVFHEGLKRISQSAFISNNSLKSVTLPSSIKYIGAFNFDDAEDIYLTGGEDVYKRQRFGCIVKQEKSKKR